MRKLICKFFGHKWIPDVGDIYANLMIGGECQRCKKRTACVGFEPDYQYQVVKEMLEEPVKPTPNMLYLRLPQEIPMNDNKTSQAVREETNLAPRL